MKGYSVFVGPSNVAGNAYYIAKALRTVGVNARSFSYNSNPFNYPIDSYIYQVRRKKNNLIGKVFLNRFFVKGLNSVIKFIFLFYSFFLYKHYFFISTSTLFKNNKDLFFLRLFNKKISFIFAGCRERFPGDPINLSDGGFCSFCTDFSLQKACLCHNIEKKKKLISYLEKKADYIFSLSDTKSFLAYPGKTHGAFVISEAPETDKEIRNKFQDKTINIVHFPSHQELKGTENVLRVMAELKQIYQDKINFICEKLTNSEVLNVLKKSHILIDQFANAHGLLAVEGMAMGCVVVGRLSKWFVAERPEVPIVNTEKENLKETLIELIENQNRMPGIALKSMEYFKKTHSLEAVGNYYKKTFGL